MNVNLLVIKICKSLKFNSQNKANSKNLNLFSNTVKMQTSLTLKMRFTSGGKYVAEGNL